MALKKGQVWSKLVWGGVSAGHVFFTFVLEAFRTLPFSVTFLARFQSPFFHLFFRFWRLPGQVYFTFFSRFFGAYMVTFVSRFFHVFLGKT